MRLASGPLATVLQRFHSPLNTAADTARRDFLERLALTRRMSPHTVAAYGRDLDTLVAHLDRHGVTTWEAVTPARIEAWLAERHRRGLDPRSLARSLAAVRSFFRHLIREGQTPRNPALGLRAPKARRKLPEVPDVDAVAALFVADDDPETGDAAIARRDRAMIELFYSSALRLAELAGLDCADLDLAAHTVRVMGKGRRERVVPVGAAACAAITQWIEARTEIAPGDETALFVSRTGRRLSARAIQDRLARWARRKGYAGRLHPHLLRHACASHLLESSGDLRAVQELLGHADLATTQIYTHLDYQHLAEVYDRTHPRARRKG